MELSSKRYNEDNIKYPAACMQNCDKLFFPKTIKRIVVFNNNLLHSGQNEKL